MQDLAQASDALAEVGFAVPRWADLPRHGPAPATGDADPDNTDVSYRSWQRSASRVLDDRASAKHRRDVGLAELALLDSQSGPFAYPLAATWSRSATVGAQGQGQAQSSPQCQLHGLWGLCECWLAGHCCQPSPSM